MRLPRQGTRVAALFDELYVATKQADGSVWRPLKDAYDNADPAYSHKMFGPRRWSSMTVSKLLRKYATKRGNPGSQFYTMKPEWVELVEGRTEAGAKVIGALVEAVNAQNCGEKGCEDCAQCSCKSSLPVVNNNTRKCTPAFGCGEAGCDGCNSYDYEARPPYWTSVVTDPVIAELKNEIKVLEEENKTLRNNEMWLRIEIKNLKNRDGFFKAADSKISELKEKLEQIKNIIG